jgi:hypothetical protein
VNEARRLGELEEPVQEATSWRVASSTDSAASTDNDGQVEVAKAARGDKGWYGMPLRATAAGTPDTDGISDAITPAPR